MKLIDNNKATEYGRTVHGFNIINGRDVESEGRNRFDSTNPSFLDDVVGSFPESDSLDVEMACKVATEAYQTWKKTPAPVRGEIIGNIGRLLTENKETLAKIVTREIGKTLKEARGSVQEAIDTAHFFQSEGRRLYGQTVPSEMNNKELYTYRKPLGVTGIITAGNFPIAVPSWKIIPAILCGNTVVWKPSEDAPTTAYLFGKILHEAGLPDGVVNIVNGHGPTTGQAMLQMIDKGYFQKFSFTGSTVVGKMIGEVCGRNLVTPSLELGGKNPLIVMEDADLELAVNGALWAGFGSAGQRCTSLGNLILHRDIAEKFKGMFMEKVRKIKIGNPCTGEDVLYGPMISKKFRDNFLEHFEMGKADGARLLYGNGVISSENKPESFVGVPEEGLYMWPTVWDQVTMDMRLAQKEIFGPVVTIVEVGNIDEALEAANATQYGLSSAIYTNNPHYMYRFKTEMEAGMSSINNSTTGAEAHLPFGGTKGSGNNTRESGIWVIDAYTRWHAINADMSGRLQLAQMETEYIPEKQPTDYNSIFG